MTLVMFRQMFNAGQDGGTGGGGIRTAVSLLIAAVVIFCICLLFHQFCEPAPNAFEQAVFYSLIFLIFLETVYAGVYRSEE